MRQPDLFAPAPARVDLGVLSPTTPGLHRKGDHYTSVAAAAKIETRLSALQEKVYDCLAAHPGITDQRIEELMDPDRTLYAETTLSKRRTDLVNMGLVGEVGWALNRRGGKMKTWAVIAPKPVGGF